MTFHSFLMARTHCPRVSHCVPPSCLCGTFLQWAVLWTRERYQTRVLREALSVRFRSVMPSWTTYALHEEAWARFPSFAKCLPRRLVQHIKSRELFFVLFSFFLSYRKLFYIQYILSFFRKKKGLGCQSLGGNSEFWVPQVLAGWVFYYYFRINHKILPSS